MRMKVCYIAHPISGDVSGNLEKIKNIVREINLTHQDVVPFAPYYLDCQALDDANPVERQRGIRNDVELLARGFVDELWLFGDTISAGMHHEIRLAGKYSIPVVPKSSQTQVLWPADKAFKQEPLTSEESMAQDRLRRELLFYQNSLNKIKGKLELPDKNSLRSLSVIVHMVGSLAEQEELSDENIKLLALLQNELEEVFELM